MRNRHGVAGILAATLIIVGVVYSGVTLPNSENNPNPVNAQSKLTVLLIDAPVELDQLNVTVTELEVHKAGDGDSDGEWIPLMEEEEETTFNLLYYQDGRTLELASQNIDPGNFTKIRLYVSDANASYKEDPTTVIPLKVPSGKIDVIIKFEIKEGNEAIVTIDMEADWIAISKSNNLRPVLKATVSEILNQE